MIFQHTWDKIMSGQKTQTRRLVKTSHELRGNCVIEVFSGRVTYQAGKTYAVQPGRGQKSIGRVYIVDIRREDVRKITREDAQAEGFDSPLDFLLLWVNLHDPAILAKLQISVVNAWEAGCENGPIELLASRPSYKYMAWALTFQLTNNYLTQRIDHHAIYHQTQ